MKKRICKSLIINIIICISSIAIGYRIATYINEIPLLQSQNVRIAHEFYFGLNLLCTLDQIDSPYFKMEETIQKAEELYYILELCEPYVAFPLVYGERLSADEVGLLKEYLSTIIDILKNNEGMISQADESYLRSVSINIGRALSSETPLKTLCTLIGDE